MLAPPFVGPVKAFLVAAALFIPFERLAGLHPAQLTFRRGWAMDVLTGLLNGLLLYLALLAALGALDAAAAFVAPQLRHWIETRTLLAQTFLALVVGDLGVYGIHRLQHTVPWLWRFHAVHHSAEELDWLVGFRFHPIDLFLLRVASLGPLVALDVAPSAVAILIAVSGWQSWLVHANVRMPYGPLRWLLVSPEFHHWHHSAEREAYNRNYASLVASWDVLFGTVYLPRDRQPLRYGIEEPLPAGWIGRFVHPFRRGGTQRGGQPPPEIKSGAWWTRPGSSNVSSGANHLTKLPPTSDAPLKKSTKRSAAKTPPLVGEDMAYFVRVIASVRISEAPICPSTSATRLRGTSAYAVYLSAGNAPRSYRSYFQSCGKLRDEAQLQGLAIGRRIVPPEVAGLLSRWGRARLPL